MRHLTCPSCACLQQWKPVPRYEGVYDVSDHGMVWSCERYVRSSGNALRRAGGRLLTLTTQKISGYQVINLCIDAYQRTYYVHDLVLRAFIGPPPEGMEGCHWDNVPANNHLANLRWDTPSANGYDKVRHGTHHSAAKTHCPTDHLLVMPNLVTSRLPYRICLSCARSRAAQHYARKRGRSFDFRLDSNARYAKIMSSS